MKLTRLIGMYKKFITKNESTTKLFTITDFLFIIFYILEYMMIIPFEF